MVAIHQPEGAQAKRIADYLSHLDIAELALWDDLDTLSTHTRVDAVEVPLEGVVLESGGAFSAILNLYLSLQYGRDDDEGFTTSDSFLAKVRGHVIDGTPVVEASSVDTSSFYE